MTLIEPRRQRRLRQVIEGDQALVEAHGVPDGSPEGGAAVPDHLGADLEQAGHQARQVGRGQVEGRRDAPGGVRP